MPGPHLFAQHYPFTVITLKDGLPQCAVVDIEQDQQGYIWLATGGGVCRYDGNEFRSFTYGAGLDASQIMDIAIDPKGRLWLATFGNGLAFYDGGQFHSIGVEQGFQYPNIRYLLFSKAGDLWISTHEMGVVRVSINGFLKIQTYGQIPKTYATKKMIELPNGNILVFGKPGFIEFEKVKNYQPRFVSTRGSMFCAELDSTGGLWLGGKEQLYYKKDHKIFDRSTWLPPSSRVIDFLLDGDRIFIATNQGILKMEGDKKELLRSTNGLSDNDVQVLYKDKFGNIWAGTHDGATILNERGMVHYDQDGSGGDFMSFTLMEDTSGDIWFGQSLKGYFKCTYSGVVKTRVQFPGTIVPNQTYLDEAGNIFVLANYQDIYKIENEKIVWEWNLPDSIFSINAFLPLVDSTLLMGTTDGVFIVDEQSKKMRKIQPVTGYNQKDFNYVIAFYDEYKNPWMVSDEGAIYKFTNDGLIDYGDKMNPGGSIIKHALYDPFHHAFWFASEEGVFVWDGKHRYEITTKSGLKSNLNYCITQDKTGRIWAGSIRGVACIDVEKMTVTNYGYDQGFLPIETNGRAAITDSKGNVWIGTLTGPTKILVNELGKDTILGKLRLQKIWVNEQEIYVESFEDTVLPKLSLNHNENNLNFQVASLCYTNAKDVTYTWKLEGMDQHWNTKVNHYEIEYFNLPPGSYRLKIKAKNPDGFITNELVIPVFIAKPFWKTAIFYLSEIFIFITIVFLSFRFTRKSSNNRFGQVMTLLTILIIFESVMLYISNYTDKYTNGIPVFQLVMNVILAASLYPLEQSIKNFMQKRSRRKKDA
jgi:ligand-binding sensor domain-containing protein